MKLFFLSLLLLSAKEILNAQSVGIGTATPAGSAQLDVTSTSKGLLIPRMSGSQRIAISGPVAGLLVYQTNFEIVPPSSPGFYLFESGGWKRVAKSDEITAGSPTWTVSGSDQYSNVAGSVGIGTASPDPKALLDINSTTKGFLIPRMTTTQRNAIGSSVPGLLVYDNSLKEFYHADGTGWRQMLNSSNSPWKTSSTFNRVYNTTDSIGIGTSSPDEKLHVLSGSIYVQDNRTNQNPHVIFDIPSVDGNEGGLLFKRSGDTLAAINYVADEARPNYIRISGGNAGSRNDLVVNSNGETGLGTADPVARLHVRAIAGADAIAVTSGLPGVPSSIQFYTDLIGGLSPKGGFVLLDGYDLKIGTNSGNVNGRFIVRTDGADRMFVDEAGNVSIGTTATAAGYKLHVGGKAICEELKVQLIANWPDYVFHDQYNLRPISELKSFINKNKHLPGIPPAAEVEKNGIELGDMQKKLLQKIEELTLYVVQLKEEIDALKSAKK